MLQLCKTLGKDVRHFQEKKQASHKEGGGLSAKIPELRHNVLSNEKDASVVLHLDFFEFRVINEVWRAFFVKKRVFC